MQADLFFVFLREHWKKKKRKVFPKGKTWLNPLTVERKYFKYIKQMLNKLIVIEKSFQIVDLKQMLRKDTGVYDLQKRLQQEYENYFKEENTQGTILGYATEVNQYNNNQWKKFSMLAIGFAFTGEEQWLQNTLTEWVALNQLHLKNLGQEYITKINTIVSKAVQQGMSYQSVAEEIKSINKNFTEKRAKLLAVDQIGTLNGLITKYRQLDADIQQYIWQTAHDERVRGNPDGKYPKAVPSHWIMHNKYCKWEDPSVYSDDGSIWKQREDKMPKEIPGTSVNCRCSAIPHIQELLNRLG